MDFSIIQWNLNGFSTRKINLKRRINQHNPSVICLQETHFKNNFCAKLNGYLEVFKNRNTNNHASGGVAIYIYIYIK